MNKTIICPAASQARGQELMLTILGETGYFITGLGATSEGPVTHYITSGPLPEIDGFDFDRASALHELCTICDVSDEENFVAMARLGLVIVQPPDQMNQAEEQPA